MKNLITLSILLILNIAASAQIDPLRATGDNASGINPFGSYDHGQFDSIDLASGGVNAHIDLASLVARGHKSHYSWYYSSKFWSLSVIYGQPGGPISSWNVENNTNSKITPNCAQARCVVGPGWNDSRTRMAYQNVSMKCYFNGALAKTYLLKTNYVYTDDHGAKHSFPNWHKDTLGTTTGCMDFSTGMDVGYASDISALRLDTTSNVTGTVTLPTGSNPFGDTNGNTWSYATAANGQNYLQVTTDPTDNRVTQMQALDESGNWQTYVMSYSTIQPTATFYNPYTIGLNSSLYSLAALTGVSLPNGKAYTFEYNGPAGELTKIILPTGGYIRYQYQTIAKAAMTPDGAPADADYVTRRFVSPDGTQASEQMWQYDYSRSDPNNPSSPLTTTVTRPDGSSEIHHFVRTSDEPYREDRVEYHEPNGTLKQTVTQDWACDNVPETSSAYAGTGPDDPGYVEPFEHIPWGNCRITGTTRILDNGLQAKTTTTYDTFTYPDPASGATVTTSYGNAKEIDETAYGQGAPGAIIRKTKFRYQYEQDVNYKNAYMLNQVYAKWVGTPANTLSLSETLYDTTTPAGIHGNPSVFKTAILSGNTTSPTAPNPDNDPSSITVGSWLSTTVSYDSYGNVTQISDPRSNSKTYEYTQCNAGYASAVNYPITGLREERTWNCNIGAVATSKDMNLLVTTYSYKDPTTNASEPMNRLRSISYPDGGFQQFDYDDTARILTSTRKIDTSRNQVTKTVYDGLGRKVGTQLTSDPAGTVYADTTYDTVGRVNTVSNAYRSTSESTYGLTTNAYDVLDRLTRVTHPDGNYIQTDYNGNVSTVSDETGRQRKSATDALGHLLEVDEPTEQYIPYQPPVPAAPGTATVTINGSEKTAQIQNPGAYATGNVTITGNVQKWVDTSDCVIYHGVRQCTTYYDNGTVYLSVNGCTRSTDYTQGDDSTTVAGRLSAAFNAGGCPVTTSVSGNVISFQSTTQSASANYPLSFSTIYNSSLFGRPSFGAILPASGTLTGGQDPTTTTVYDAGTLTVTVNGHQDSITWGAGSAANTVASGLAANINADGGAYVSASASNNVVTLSARQSGASTNYSLSSSSSTSQGQYFSSPSFTATNPSALSGGTDGSPAVPAHTLWTFSPQYVTSYSYDVLGNLLEVDQQGNDSNSANWRTRLFTYDSGSRLLTANNPESGTICYGTWSGSNCINGYDANGNLVARTDARTVVTNYTYDALNRLTQKSYSNDPSGTVSVQYGYDGAAGTVNCPPAISTGLGLGKRTSMCDAAGKESWKYELTPAVGWKTTDQRTIGTVTKTVLTQNNFAGFVASITYPSGMVASYGYNSAGQPSSVTDNNGNNYVGSVTYLPHGEIGSALYAATATFAGILQCNQFNSRLQPVNLGAFRLATCPTDFTTPTVAQTVLNLNYDFAFGTADNGNVNQINNRRDTTRSVKFTYDVLDRLASADTLNSNLWANSFQYDPWGNLNKMLPLNGKPTGQNWDQMANAKNQIIGFCYDAAGNLTKQAACGSADYTYDGENRLISTAGVTYTYDGDGQRVKKSNGTLYWGSGPLAESDLSGNIQREFVRLNGKRIARRDLPGGAVHYYFSDHLGSADVVANSTGTVENESDYYPFGGERVITSTLTNQNYKFTGKERDSESGLDFFGARFYANQMGRWMSPDWATSPVPVPYAILTDPQTLNLYTYVRNNPTTVPDANGHYAQEPIRTPEEEEKEEDEFEKEWKEFAARMRTLRALTPVRPDEQAAPKPGWDDPTTGVCHSDPMTEQDAKKVADELGKPGAPGFLISPGGDVIPVPRGAQGPDPVVNPSGRTTGVGFGGGSGGPGLDPKVSGVRVMDPTPPRGSSPGYPNGYVVYQNPSGQGVNPQTGRTIPNSDPARHIPLSPPNPPPKP